MQQKCSALQAIAVLAVGTRGDVQPLLALAAALRESLGDVCTLLTHRAHQARRNWLRPCRRRSAALLPAIHERACMPCHAPPPMQDWVQEAAQEAGLNLRFLSSLPARRWDAAQQQVRKRSEHCQARVPDSSHCSTQSRFRVAILCSLQGEKRKAGEDDSVQQGAADTEQERQREELIEACCAALGCAVPTHAGGFEAAQAAAADAAHEEQRGASSRRSPSCQTLQPQPLQRLIVFNLFALGEGFSIAEALGVPCLAASPCLVPYAAPSSLRESFQSEHPQLFERLQAAAASAGVAAGSEQQQQAQPGESAAGHALKTCIANALHASPLTPQAASPAAVAHLLQRRAVGRRYSTGCGPCLASGGAPGATIGLACPPCRFLTAHQAYRCHHRRRYCTVGGCPRPCHTAGPVQPVSRSVINVLLVLPCLLAFSKRPAGVSEAVVARPGYWPPSVHMCSVWSSLRCFSAKLALPREVEQLLALQQGQSEAAAAPAAAAATGGADAAAAMAAPICVDFGSMGQMGLLPRPAQLVAVLHAAARKLQRRILLLTAGWQPLLEACRRQQGRLVAGEPQEGSRQQQAEPPWVLAVAQALPHAVVLPRCAALLHHGGAGTTAAALQSGTPQLVCPLHFDQHQWAERVAWLGCGAQLSPAALLQQPCGSSGVKEDEGQQQQQEVEQAGAELAAVLQGLLQDAGMREACGRLRAQLAAEDGLGAAVCLVRRQLDRQDPPPAQQQQQQREHGVPAEPSATAAWAVAVRELDLPGGLRVRCISPSEALFIHREVFEQDCYLPAGMSLPPGSVVIDAGRRGREWGLGSKRHCARL